MRMLIVEMRPAEVLCQVLVVALLLTPYTLGVPYVLVPLYLSSPLKFYFHFFLSSFLTFGILAIYWKASLASPDFVPKNLIPKNNIETEINYCKICKNWKPPRTHHCKICNVCVLKMDHHCN